VRIAVVASPVTPLRPVQLGGAQAFLCDLAAGLAARGHDVALHCAEGSELPGVRLVTVPAPRDAAAALVMPGGAPPPPAPGVAAAIAAMLRAAASADVVSQHAFDAPAFELARGMPVIHTLHLPPIVESVVEAVSRVEPSRLVTVSRAGQAAWRTAGVEVGEVIPNGVGEVAGVATAMRPDRAALVAGRVSPEKGIEHAIAAAGRAGLAVRVAGAHYDPAYEVDLSGAERLGVLSRNELRFVMARSAVTICAVRWDEPFGLVAAEAQMAGCPVAAYRRGAMPEVVEEGVSGFLAEPDDIDSLAEAVERCLSLDRRAVRSSALRRLSLETSLDRYEQALERAAR
jgi:UDP-glucose:tetrahydrobiopterin glucosyltransferase